MYPESHIVRVTEKGGVLVHVGGSVQRDVWFFQDQIHENSEVWTQGRVGRLVIPEWIARQKGLV